MPIADEPWIKIANFEWAEPNHTPMVDADSPGYWQPDWVDGTGFWWRAPYHVLREGTAQQQRWRDKEAAYYRITRAPAWDDGPVVVTSEGIVVNEQPGVPVRATFRVVKGADSVQESNGRTLRQDGVWRYRLHDRLASSAEGHLYTIEASTCRSGPWSESLELQRNVVGAPSIASAYLTRTDSAGEALPDDRVAVAVSWRFERGDLYWVELVIRKPDGRREWNEGHSIAHLDLPGSGGSKRIELAHPFETDFDWSGFSVEVKIAASHEHLPGQNRLGPWSPTVALSVPIGGL